MREERREERRERRREGGSKSMKGQMRDRGWRDKGEEGALILTPFSDVTRASSR